MGNSQDASPENEAMWRDVLTRGHRSRMAVLPSSPRCTICQMPFGGIGGTVVRLIGRRPSRKSSNLCNL